MKTGKDIKVVMVGLGYIGLPTAALIASKGIQVHGVDINQSVVDTINEGKIHIVEPDLDGLVKHDVERGYLKASTKTIEADVYLIAVPTPFKGNFEPDLKYVEAAADAIAPKLKEGNLLIIESTSPVGTTEAIAKRVFLARPELKGKLFMAYCPERVLPGNVIYELEHNDRVIGGMDEPSTQEAQAFYAKFVKGKLHPTNSRTAEMCKLVENAYRDVNIAFANELSMICDKADINVNELIALASKHPRVKILSPGPGVGGHCIAVDPWFIVNAYPEEAKIIRSAREVNNYKSEWVYNKIVAEAVKFEKEQGRKPVIACLGLAYKPDIDDLRESPALHITQSLIRNTSYPIMAVEPNITSLKGFDIFEIDQAKAKADLWVILVAHKEFKNGSQDKAHILDFCNALL